MVVAPLAAASRVVSADVDGAAAGTTALELLRDKQRGERGRKSVPRAHRTRLCNETRLCLGNEIEYNNQISLVGVARQDREHEATHDSTCIALSSSCELAPMSSLTLAALSSSFDSSTS